ncbi:MAG: DNA topoisomerase 3 [Oligoflexales bacterium]
MVAVVVAEKPSVARDIAAALGIKERHKGYFAGKAYKITWAIGHLVKLGDPADMEPAWKSWNLRQLPMIPKGWILKVSTQTIDQFKVVKRLLNARETSEVICATDAGREGELIFRFIYEEASCSKPIKRLWISSLTKSAIQKGFKNLKDGELYNNLADSARGRSRADWLVGMNLSRAYSLVYKDVLSIGRVQTPTLAILVQREKEILNFVPEKYAEIKGVFSCLSTDVDNLDFDIRRDQDHAYIGWYVGPVWAHNFLSTCKEKTDWLKARRLSPKDSILDEILKTFKGASAKLEKIAEKTNEILPPLFYDLTELQRHANRLCGFSAKKTLDIAQSLYEQKKCISYPRTDCRYISKEEAKILPKVVEAVKAPYALIIKEETGHVKLGKRHVNDAKVGEHHGILPTGVEPVGLNKDQRLIYDLVCIRLLSAYQDSYKSSTTTLLTSLTSKLSQVNEKCYYFASKGTRVLQLGWKALEEEIPMRAAKKSGEPILPTELQQGMHVYPIQVKKREASTKPPPPMTEARLLTGMETAGSLLEEKDLSNAMKDTGLGTPATRAAIIETLIKRDYILRDGKSLRVKDKGMQLIDLVNVDLKSPKMTGEWESLLDKISRGQLPLDSFMTKIEAHVSKLVTNLAPLSAKVGESPSQMISQQASRPIPEARTLASHYKQEPQNSVSKEASVQKTQYETNKASLEDILRDCFGLKSFRKPQKQVCAALLKGEDALIVMPTGAGKSLCYQLPSLARQGTGLIISPLIALMEDQVTKLNDLGLRAERIHSGRSREESREVCRQYLKGNLDFLFVAPERLGLPGFMQLLAQKQLALVAIDEAHCISQWGHDFRSDYRKIGERLEVFAKVPKIALTATATKEVQKDILEQLSLESSSKFIAGFRRKNLQLEVVNIPKNERFAAIMSFLQHKKNRPAIIYVLTRKETEKIAASLSAVVPARAYHAGLSTDYRQKVQDEFMSGKTDVVVATVAFGMGIDKNNIRSVIHMALPSTLAGYYQEIGRAGRDGKPSKAIMLYSYVDQKTHLFLHDVNYPEPSLLADIYEKIPKEGISRHELLELLDHEEGEVFLEKLWIHGAIVNEHSSMIYPSKESWEDSYRKQKEFRLGQLDSVWNFAKEANACRMVQLIRYFGDTEDSKPCKSCDICIPGVSEFKSLRTPSQREKQILKDVWNFAKERKSWSKTSLFQYVSKKKLMVDRDTFDLLLNSLLNYGFLQSSHASFKKNGKNISYEQLSVPPANVSATGLEDIHIIQSSY